MFAFNLLACLKKDIVAEFCGNYKEKHKVAVETLLKRLDVTGRNVPVSWLGNRRIEVRFK